ncbi:MAG: hypothetical protein R3C11_12190 [Planctomycetaceae bacterium]
MMNYCLLAVDSEEVIAAVFLIITFLSWVFQAINSKQEKNGNKQAGAGRPKPQRKQQKQSFENEIERFLKEVNDPDGARREREQQARREQTERSRPIRSARVQEEEFEIEIIDEPPPTPAQRRRQRQRAQQSRERANAPAKQPAARYQKETGILIQSNPAKA